jgi:hypothetical protein
VDIETARAGVEHRARGVEIVAQGVKLGNVAACAVMELTLQTPELAERSRSARRRRASG